MLGRRDKGQLRPVTCEVHQRHSPKPGVPDRHHVIPVQFQLAYAPTSLPPDAVPGDDFAGRGYLWDARTVQVCPTGHHVVHEMIVAAMHALLGDAALTATAAVEVTRAARGFDRQDSAVSLLGLARLEGAGANLRELAAAGHWGQL